MRIDDATQLARSASPPSAQGSLARLGELTDVLVAMALMQSPRGASVHGGVSPDAGEPPSLPDVTAADLAEAFQALTAGDWLRRQHDLSELECAVLAVLVAVELDSCYEAAFAVLQEDPSRRRPSIELVLKLFGLGRADRIKALGALYTGSLWSRRLLESEREGRPSALASDGVRLDRQLHALFVPGVSMDPRLTPFCTQDIPQHSLEDCVLRDETRQMLQDVVAQRRMPLRLHLRGAVGSGKRWLAAALAKERRKWLLRVDLRRCAMASAETQASLMRAVREAWLRGALLYCEGLDRLEDDDRLSVGSALAEALGEYPVHCVIGSAAPWPAQVRMPGGLVRVEVALPGAAERAVLWQRAALVRGSQLASDDAITLAERFRMSAEQIEQAVDDVIARHGEDASLHRASCAAAARALSGHALEQLARRIAPRAAWSQLILAHEVEEQLREISQRARQRTGLNRQWAAAGAQHRLTQERGITALFAGPSGVGKTLAAEVIAGDLGLDLFCVDLALVVSKYIGETEKNLDRVFSAAENANAVLFFDEAEALFGKRSDVKDAHDRYANLEIAYLLQKMEQFEGLAILATNLRQNLDDAFMRRVSFVVGFALPEEAERKRLWRAHWPQALERDAEVELDELACGLPLSGGNIRNMVLAAAHFATADHSAVSRDHLLRAALREYQKMGKTMTDADWKRLELGVEGRLRRQGAAA